MLIGKKMKICELKKILVDYGVPKDLYNFDGTGRTDERFCIERVQEGWNVFYIERGCRTTNLIFDSEEEACQFLYKELLE